MKNDTGIIEKVKYSPEAVRNEFPILGQEINGKPLIYFDNAATTQKPGVVIEALKEYYTGYNANIHRGIHTLAEKATAAFENTRSLCASFLNSREKEEIIFTYGTTDGINLVAQAYGRKILTKGDEVIISALEHHSNIVPWQMVCNQTRSKLRVIPINDRGELIIEEYEKLLSDKTKIVSVNHVSNALGTINPIKTIIDKAHAAGAVVLIDGAQASAHIEIDVKNLNCDFYVFSSHKIFGPTGVGVLYGKRELLEKMDAYRGGGEMISEVTFEKTTYNDIPFKFEAGTPNIADVIGLGAAIRFFRDFPRAEVEAAEKNLLIHATHLLNEIKNLRIIGEAVNKTGIISFVSDRIHHFDLGMMLDAQGIAVRTGHHCTQPLMDRFGIEGTTRLSFSIYNTISEVDRFFDILNHTLKKIG
jgi:cysteine desulfurase / selenocysteine lyase